MEVQGKGHSEVQGAWGHYKTLLPACRVSKLPSRRRLPQQQASMLCLGPEVRTAALQLSMPTPQQWRQQLQLQQQLL
jgi:hypothetical protein